MGSKRVYISRTCFPDGPLGLIAPGLDNCLLLPFIQIYENPREFSLGYNMLCGGGLDFQGETQSRTLFINFMSDELMPSEGFLLSYLQMKGTASILIRVD